LWERRIQIPPVPPRKALLIRAFRISLRPSPHRSPTSDARARGLPPALRGSRSARDSALSPQTISMSSVANVLTCTEAVVSPGWAASSRAVDWMLPTHSSTRWLARSSELPRPPHPDVWQHRTAAISDSTPAWAAYQPCGWLAPDGPLGTTTLTPTARRMLKCVVVTARVALVQAHALPLE
jgi:hypothetical protein